MVLVDANYKFMTWGYMSDCQIFNNSKLKQCMYDNSISFPQILPFTNDDRGMPYFIVGDDAFPIMTNLMKPLQMTQFDPQSEYIQRQTLQR